MESELGKMMRERLDNLGLPVVEFARRFYGAEQKNLRQKGQAFFIKKNYSPQELKKAGEILNYDYLMESIGDDQGKTRAQVLVSDEIVPQGKLRLPVSITITLDGSSAGEAQAIRMIQRMNSVVRSELS